MPRAIGPQVQPVLSVLPVKQFPEIRHAIGELDFVCPNCSDGMGVAAYRNVADPEQCHLEPLGAPASAGGGVVTARGMVSTRYMVFCKDCMTPPNNVGPFQGNVIDLLEVDSRYKKPIRDVASGGSGLSYDDEDGSNVDEHGAILAVKMPVAEEKVRKFGGKRLKKDSELNPKSKTKKAPLTDEQKAAKAALKRVPKDLLQEVMASNKEAVPQADRPEVAARKKK
jgi:hypothetical protein